MPTSRPEAPQANGRAAATRLRILDAAVAEFAEHGLAGARIDEIAARADANKRMIYAYFGSKDDLWSAVLDRVYADKRDQESSLHVEKMPPLEAVAKLVSFNLRYVASHPEFVTLLNQENLHRAAFLSRSHTIRTRYTPLLACLRDVLRRGEAEGVFRGGIDPMQLYITLIGLSHFYMANRFTLSAIFGASLTTKKSLAAREAHCLDVMLGYLRAT